MATHILKTHAAPFEQVWAGTKLFELRRDDRVPAFAVGDIVYLVEWDAVADRELPRYIGAVVTCVVRDSPHGLVPGHAILGLNPDLLRCIEAFSGSRSAAAALVGRVSRTRRETVDA